MATQNVRFYFGTQAKFDTLVEKNPIALYFIEDTQRLYKGNVLMATGSNATSMAAGLMSIEDKKKLDALVVDGGIDFTPVDSSIVIADGQDGDKTIGVAISTQEGNLVSVKDDGIFAAVESLPIGKIIGLEDRLVAIENASIGGIHYRGSVATTNDLPSDAIQGDLYEVLEDNSEWCFNGEKWFEYGHTVDFSPVAGDGIEVDGSKISVKIAEESHGLVAIDGALMLKLATADYAGALSPIDKEFIDSIPSTYSTIDRVKDTAVQVKYKISDTPEGTLVNYGEKEIRIMCPTGAKFVKQAVGTGGDANTYYITFKTYAPSENVVGYIEHLGDKVDSEILTSFSTDEYGRRYQSTWLGVAKYDEATGAWNYYGNNSTEDKYIGWDYQIDWYDANGIMVASDVIRINLSNEECHNSIQPYYMGGYATIDQIEDLQDNFVWGEL